MYGRDDEEEMSGEDADTIVAKRGGTGWNIDGAFSSLSEARDSSDEHRCKIGGGGVVATTALAVDSSLLVVSSGLKIKMNNKVSTLDGS